MKVTVSHNLNLPSDNKKYKLMVGIIDNQFLATLARELDQGSNKIIPIPPRVLAVVPEAVAAGFTEWDGIPSRPFIEKTIELHGKSWGPLLIKFYKATKSILNALNNLGEVILNQLKDIICTYSWEKNSWVWELYKERMGTDPNPLLHTKKFLDSLSYKVIEHG